MKRALLIGLNYNNSPYQLNCCENDVNELNERMLSSKVETQVISSNIGISDLSTLLSSYRAVQKKGDTFYLVYSGHGTQVPGKESDKYDEAICLFKNKKIELYLDDTLRSELEKFGGQVVVIFDSCFSGGMERTIIPNQKRFIPFELLDSDISITQKVNQRSNVYTKINFMFACSEDEVAYEADGHGYFTGLVLENWDKGVKYIKPIYKNIVPKLQGTQSPVHKTFNTTGFKKLF